MVSMEHPLFALKALDKRVRVYLVIFQKQNHQPLCLLHAKKADAIHAKGMDGIFSTAMWRKWRKTGLTDCL